jgi:hypothetical protein
MQLGLRAGFDGGDQLGIQTDRESQWPQRCDNGGVCNIKLAADGRKPDLDNFLRSPQCDGRPLGQRPHSPHQARLQGNTHGRSVFSNSRNM